MIERRKTRVVSYGDVEVGGKAPVSVQSMTDTKTHRVQETVAQIKKLEKNGCEIIRVAVPDKRAVSRLNTIRERINIPLIADIHFNYRLALGSIKKGVDGLRINPGNIGSESKIKQVIRAAEKADIPIRIGVNAGSLQPSLLSKYGGPTPEAMVASALQNIRIMEKCNFRDIIVSLKSSDVLQTVEAYRKLADRVDYPFHIGITEAGTCWRGTIKSAVGIGTLLYRGLGDTVRVSLTADPVEEVRVAWQILRSLKIRWRGPEIISCPGCGRTEIDLVELAERVEERVENIDKDITIAVMGCAVNGPGEAREADIGIAGGRGQGLIFKNGKKLKSVDEEQLLETLLTEINKL